MSGQASTSTDPPSMTVQPRRGKVKFPDNYPDNRIESQKFMLQCLLLFAAESDRYKTNQDKISLVLSCMRYGTAGAWVENFLLKLVGADPPTDLEAFAQFEETRRDTWVRQGEETARLIWKEKTTHPLWETKREYIEEWRWRMLITTTSGYHNLVLRWNIHTLPHPDDPKRTISNASCRLTDDREMEASVILLESEQS
ncbi:hypothetical protein HETIRDRAFT_98969 [Heterobasidion irregulare TC 32-1]|uniref:DUF4939 domain-containing protein n=1 Tax=Heterobasidion irregulare (strain TC 32-1) TaxID=747525 RepID=W4KN26_HETIT|nr:uncharacterized protein HETIRDRAFT_98969 [Heterobasidion irregulare TC 32-1]ETW86446.1 hypothetical protein HETIRDRAFT_98969 [Heterobasidion irregulare TC 32-1]